MNKPTQPKPKGNIGPSIVAAAIALLDAERVSNECAEEAAEAIERSKDSILAVNVASEKLTSFAKDIEPGEALMLPGYNAVVDFRGAGVFIIRRNVLVADLGGGS